VRVRFSQEIAEGRRAGERRGILGLSRKPGNPEEKAEPLIGDGRDAEDPLFPLRDLCDLR
jgi:hypothetical protein